MSARTIVWRVFAVLVLLFCVPSARPEDGQCDIPDVGAMTIVRRRAGRFGLADRAADA